MLSLLHIENIAVIESADISFDQGFNVLTGETGAGKSIVIDAISAILGERAYRDMIRIPVPHLLCGSIHGSGGLSPAGGRTVPRRLFPRAPW